MHTKEQLLEYFDKINFPMQNREDFVYTFNKWKDKLTDINDLYIKNSIAMLIENQKLTDDNTDNDFKELIIKLYDPNVFIGFDIVSIQPHLRPGNLIQFYNNRKLETEAVSAITKSLISTKQNIETICSTLTKTINAEILRDLLNNCGTVIKSNDPNEAITNISNIMANKIGHYPNWVVANNEIAKNIDLEIKIIEEPLLPNSILIGYKGSSPYEAGYFYNPYIPLVAYKDVTKTLIMTRYSKKLIPGGNKFYGKIEIY